MRTYLPFLAITLMCTGICFPQWSKNPATGTPVCAVPDDQLWPRILSDSAGGAYVTWFHSGTNVAQLASQRISQTGALQWPAQGLVTLDKLETYPVVNMIRSEDGGYFLNGLKKGPWMGMPPNPTWHTIRKIGRDGTSAWPDSGIIVSRVFLGFLGNITLCPDGHGGAFYAYDYYDSLRVGRIDSSGSLLWGFSGTAIEESSSDPLISLLVPDTSDGVYCIWCNLVRSWPGTSGVYAQRLSGNGVPLWNVQQRNQTPVLEILPTRDIFGLPDGRGGFFCATSGYGVTPADTALYQNDVALQRVDRFGQSSWGPTGKYIVHDTADQLLTALLPDDTGGMYAVFEGRSTTFGRTDQDIFVQRLDSAGNRIFPSRGLRVCSNPYVQGNSTAARDGSGGVLIAWEDARNYTADSVDIYAQRVNRLGGVEWTTDGTAVSTAPRDQREPRITGDGGGGAIVVWKDARNQSATGFDVYSARVVNPGVLMPLLGISLFAERAGASVVVRWTVMEQGNTIGYTVERAAGDGAFVSCGFLPAKAGGHDLSYAWTDTDIAKDNSPSDLSYRVRAESPDGTAAFSGIVRLPAQPPDDFSMSLYPQPSSTDVFVSIVSPLPGSISLRIVDFLGRERVPPSGAVALPPGSSLLRAPVHGLSEGIYLLEARGNFGRKLLPMRVVR